MYPILKNCLVRGSDDTYFLQQYLNGLEFILEKEIANILWNCNGGNSTEDLSHKFSQSKEEMISFLNVLKEKDLLFFEKQKTNNIVFPLLQNMPFLQEIQIEGTGKCNLWCKHCYGRESFKEASQDELSYDEIKNVIDQMFELNIGKCFLSGGEIFIRKDLPKLIEYISSKKIFISGIFTNGTIYRQDVVDSLSKTGMETTFLVSLDGMNSEQNDSLRGDGCFDKTVSFIRKIIESGFRVTINTMVTKYNVDNLFEMRMFLENLGISRWRISVLREQGESIINKNLIEPKWDKVFNVYKMILLDVLRDPKKMKVQLSSIFKTEFLERGRYYLYNYHSGTCEYKRNSLVMSSNGNLIPCPAGINIVLGNVRKDRLEDVWKRKSTQSFKNIPIYFTECKDCELLEYCGSGCRIIARQLNGSYMSKDDNACPLYKFFYREIKPIFEKNGIFPQVLERNSAINFDLNDIKMFD